MTMLVALSLILMITVAPPEDIEPPRWHPTLWAPSVLVGASGIVFGWLLGVTRPAPELRLRAVWALGTACAIASLAAPGGLFVLLLATHVSTASGWIAGIAIGTPIIGVLALASKCWMMSWLARRMRRPKLASSWRLAGALGIGSIALGGVSGVLLASDPVALRTGEGPWLFPGSAASVALVASIITDAFASVRLLGATAGALRTNEASASR